VNDRVLQIAWRQEHDQANGDRVTMATTRVFNHRRKISGIFGWKIKRASEKRSVKCSFINFYSSHLPATETNRNLFRARYDRWVGADIFVNRRRSTVLIVRRYHDTMK